MIFQEVEAMTEETANSKDMQDEIRELTRKFVEEEVARAQAEEASLTSDRPYGGHRKRQRSSPPPV